MSLLATFALSLFICSGAVQAQAQAEKTEKLAFTIPAGDLGSVLNQFAYHANIVLIFDPALTKGKSVEGLTGYYSAEEGMAILLKDTGVQAEQIQPGQYRLFAQSSSLPRLEVTPVTSATDSAIQLDTLKVQGGREIYHQPTGDAVIETAQLARVTARSASDVFSATAGVHTAQSRQEPGVAVNIRGLQDFGRVNMMIEGARQNFQRSGHGSNSAVYIDPQLLAQVSISKGPSSSVGGAAVVGGVANFRMLDTADVLSEGQDIGAKLGATTGTNGYNFSGFGAVAKQFDNNVDVVAAVSRKSIGAFEKGNHGGNSDNTDSYWQGVSQFTEQDQWAGLVKTRWKISPTQDIKFSYIGFSADFAEGSDTTNSAEAESQNSIYNHTAIVSYHWQPNESLINVSSNLYYNLTRNDQYRAASEDDEYGEFAVQYETNTIGGSMVNQSLKEFSSSDHSLLSGLLTASTGLEFFYDWTDPQASQETEGDGEVSWFTGPTPEGERWMVSTFANAEWSHDSGADLIVGLRYDYFSLEGEGEMYVGSVSNPPGVRPSTTRLFTNFAVARHQGFWSPSITLNYEIDEIFQVFTRVSRGVRPPAITESLMWGMHVGNDFPYFPNPSLKAERSTNAEVGVNMNYAAWWNADDQFSAKLVYFHNTMDNFIVQAPIMGPAATDGNSVNVAFVNLYDAVTFRGVELQAEYRTQRFFAEANATYNDVDLGAGGYDPFPLGSVVGYPPTDLGEANGGGMIYNMPPKYKGALSVGVSFFDATLDVGTRIRVENNDGRGGDSYEDLVDWTVYDAWVKYHFTSAMSLNVSVDNLTDLNYAELNGTSYWVAPGRTVSARFSASF